MTQLVKDMERVLTYPVGIDVCIQDFRSNAQIRLSIPVYSRPSCTRFVYARFFRRCVLTEAGVKRYVLPRQNDEAVILLCATAVELYSQTRWLLEDVDHNSSDSESELSSSSDDDSTNEMREFVHRIKTYTECLIDLSSALDCPALEAVHNDEPSVVTLMQRQAHDYHTDLIRAKFPKAEAPLLGTLGQTSWNRYQRMQQQRESQTHVQSALPSCKKSQASKSDFKDSRIGTSLPQVASTYAETVISFMTSASEGRRVNVPSLPAEAKNGEPFECTACGRYIQATSSREWR